MERVAETSTWYGSRLWTQTIVHPLRPLYNCCPQIAAVPTCYCLPLLIHSHCKILMPTLMLRTRSIDDTAFARPDPKTEEEYASSADEKSDGDDDETTWSASDPDSTDDAVSGATNLESAPLWLGTAYPHPSTMISSNRNPPSFFNYSNENNN
jgi:hypothetical protein